MMSEHLRIGEGKVLGLLHTRLMSYGLSGVSTEKLAEVIDELIRVGHKDGAWRADHQEVFTEIIEENLWIGPEGRDMAETFCLIRHFIEDILK